MSPGGKSRGSAPARMALGYTRFIGTARGNGWRTVTGSDIDVTAEWYDKQGKFITLYWVKGILSHQQKRAQNPWQPPY